MLQNASKCFKMLQSFIRCSTSLLRLSYASLTHLAPLAPLAPLTPLLRLSPVVLEGCFHKVLLRLSYASALQDARTMPWRCPYDALEMPVRCPGDARTMPVRFPPGVYH